MAETIFTYSEPTGIPLTNDEINQMFSDFRYWKRRNLFMPPLLGSLARPFPCPKEDSFPYGFPIAYKEEMGAVPYATDVGGIFKDPGTGLYCVINLYNAVWGSTEQGYILTGNMLSVSRDMIEWLPLSNFARAKNYPGYGQPGPNGERIWFDVTGVFIDRLNLFGQGVNYLILTADSYNGSTGNDLVILATPDIFTAPKVIGSIPHPSYSGPNGSCSDSRLYYDSLTNKMLLVAQDALHVIFFQLNISAGNFSLALLQSYNPPNPNNYRIECPGFVRIFDKKTGQFTYICTFTWNGAYAQMGITGMWDGKTFTETGQVKRLTYGNNEYAGTISDPLQQDGTGGTSVGCEEAYMTVNFRNSGISSAAATNTGPRGGIGVPSKIEVYGGEILASPPEALFDYLPKKQPSRQITGNDTFTPSETGSERSVSPNTIGFEAITLDSPKQGTSISFDNFCSLNITTNGTWQWSPNIQSGATSYQCPLSPTFDVLAVFDGGRIYSWDRVQQIECHTSSGRTLTKQISQITHTSGSLSPTGKELNRYWLG